MKHYRTLVYEFKMGLKARCTDRHQYEAVKIKPSNTIATNSGLNQRSPARSGKVKPCNILAQEEQEYDKFAL